MLCDFLLHQHYPENDVEDDQPKGHIEDAVIPGSRIHCSSQHGCYEDRYRHAHTHVAHRLANRFMANRVGQESQTDGPDDGGGDTLQKAADDEKRKSGTETKEDSCA